MEAAPPEVLSQHDGPAGLHQADAQGQQQAVADHHLVRLTGEGGEQPGERHDDRPDEGAEPGRPRQAEVGR